MTKEELIKKNAELEVELKSEIEHTELMKKEFAKAFQWYESTDMYNKERKVKTPTWSQIFVKVGKLLNTRNSTDFEGNISELECAVERLDKEMCEITKKPLN